MAATHLKMKGSCATLRSCWRAWSSSGTPLTQALMGTPLAPESSMQFFSSLTMITSRAAALGGVGLVVGLDVELALGFLREEIGADKRIEVAVEHAIHVADFEFGAMVLDEAVGLHHVGTDLAAEGDIHLGFVELLALFTALLHFEVVKFRTQHFHGHFALLVLAALHLAGHDDPCGSVCNAHRGFNLVDVLPALAAGAEGIQLQILRFDVHINAVVNFRNHKHRGERGVPASGLVKGRNPDQAVNAGFAREQAVGILPTELNRGVLDAGFFTGSLVENRGVESSALSPAKIHAQEDGSPVLGLRAAGTGLDGHDGVEVIVLAGEQCAGFELADIRVG